VSGRKRYQVAEVRPHPVSGRPWAMELGPKEFFRDEPKAVARARRLAVLRRGEFRVLDVRRDYQATAVARREGGPRGRVEVTYL
jgi:hypothetical protein